MKGPTFTDDLNKLIFNATAIALIADNASATPLTSLYVSLHTAKPVGDDQTSNEVGYTGYARVAVARTSVGWVCSGGIVSPAAAVVFGKMTAGLAAVATYFSIGTVTSGVGKILFTALLNPEIPLAINAIPRIDPLPPGSKFQDGWDNDAAA